MKKRLRKKLRKKMFDKAGAELAEFFNLEFLKRSFGKYLPSTNHEPEA